MTDLTTAVKIYPILQELSKVAEFIDVEITIRHIGDAGCEGVTKFFGQCSQGIVTLEERKD